MTSTSGLSIIGYFCWWRVNDLKITRQELQDKLIANGIDHEVPEVPMRSAFLKAVREIKASYRNKGLLIRKIDKNAEAYEFGLVDETVDKVASHLDYSHKATMKFHQSTGDVTVTTPHRAFDLVKEKYEEYKNVLNSDDVRDMILKIVSEAMCVSVRQNGGIYFVPEQHVYLVERLERLFAVLPGDNDFMVAPQIDTERSKRSIYKAFVESLKYRISEFNKDLDERGITRKGALEDRLQAFKDMRKEIEFYRDALQFQVSDLSTSLDDLKKKVELKLLS